MEWIIEFDEEFSEWFEQQEEELQDEMYTKFKLLAQFGLSLRRPHVGTIEGSQYPNLKEVIVQYKGDPWRVLFLFDPNRKGILLVGGNKRGDNRWYKKHIRIAESRYRKHLEQIGRG